eukprot:222707-Pyramimonas_sp.AAC.1
MGKHARSGGLESRLLPQTQLATVAKHSNPLRREASQQPTPAPQVSTAPAYDSQEHDLVSIEDLEAYSES